MRRVKLYPDYCTNWMVMTIAEYGVVYCLFCSTGKEEQDVRLIQEYGWGRAIFAYRIKTMLKKGAWIKAPAPLLPGYVFLYMDVTRGRFDDILRLQHVIRLLTYNDGTSALIGHDLEFADLLWRLDGQIDVMKAVQIGDRIEIIDGVFKQCMVPLPAWTGGARLSASHLRQRAPSGRYGLHMRLWRKSRSITLH